MANVTELIKEYLPFALILYGLFYVIIPHFIHQMFAPDWVIASLIGLGGFPHFVHIGLGIIFILIGAFLLRR